LFAERLRGRRSPYAALVQGTDGDFYGTTQGGGVNINYGTVFKITPSGILTTLYSFCSQVLCPDGDQPTGALVQTNGDFYGTTSYGGAHGSYAGTVFKITPNGILTTLYSFCHIVGCADGRQPYAGLIQGTDGDFYGTTSVGGANSEGTVFEITPTGMLTTLHSFDGTDGGDPVAALVQDTNGMFYGTTVSGGGVGDARSLACPLLSARLWKRTQSPATSEQPSIFWGPT